jgi:hypothetical protein
MPAYQAALAVTQYGDEPMIEINGMAHVILTVSRFEVARAFYRELLPRFGIRNAITAFARRPLKATLLSRSRSRRRD